MMGSEATEGGVTTERLKSHLQKYRINYEKSQKEVVGLFEKIGDSSNNVRVHVSYHTYKQYLKENMII